MTIYICCWDEKNCIQERKKPNREGHITPRDILPDEKKSHNNTTKTNQ
jgi:hypothetical protein